MQDCELRAKRADNDKWWGFGSIKKNKFDKYQASFKVTPELEALVLANKGGWLNFSMFEPFVKPETVEPETKKLISEILGDDSVIPF